MNSSPVDVKFPASASSIASESPFERRLFYILSAIALVYALFAGLHTVSDFDLGWQMATGRWVIQHHSVPRVDVLSYTAPGVPWTYPVGGHVLFYLAYLLGGFGLLSWLGAFACAGTVALLLRRASAVGAAIAIIAAPVIAVRTLPRADLFSVVLFAAFLSLLWEQHRSGSAKLWLLPVLMLAWVNTHLGFVAGLALMAAYVGAELADVILSAANRRSALDRLHGAWKWLACAVVVTLANPWGWGIYSALLRQQRANQAQQVWISEWVPVPLNLASIRSALWLRPTQGTIYILIAIAVVAAVIALLRTQLPEAVMLLGATYTAIKYARMGAVFACVVVVVGGPVLTPVVAGLAARIRQPRMRRIVAVVAVMLLTVLASLRLFDLVNNRHYFAGTDETTFGAGLGWWFPERAAEFIEREHLPGEVFNTYDEGGYLSWKLGPARQEYIDGRDTLFGVQRIQLHSDLLQSSPDSDEWQREAARYNINTIILALGRFDGIQMIRLQDFCNSKVWQPVYLDEISAVLVRRMAQTEDLRARFAVNCALAPLPAHPPGAGRVEAFNAWANAAGVLAALDRNAEALAATDKGLTVFPDSSFLHWQRGNILASMHRGDESEQEYLTAIELDPNEVTWSALAASYQQRHRVPEAIDALQNAAALSPRPYQLLLKLGYLYLNERDAKNAMQVFDGAARTAPKGIAAADGGTFDFMVGQGRSGAASELGDVAQAIAFQEQAAQLKPNAPEPWRRLAKLYRKAGREADAVQAEQRAAAAEKR